MIGYARGAAAAVFAQIGHAVAVSVVKRIGGNRGIEAVKSFPFVRHAVAVGVTGWHLQQLVSAGCFFEPREVLAARRNVRRDVAVGPFHGGARSARAIPSPCGGSVGSRHELEITGSCARRKENIFPPCVCRIPFHCRAGVVFAPQSVARHVHDGIVVGGVERTRQARELENIAHAVAVAVASCIVGERIETVKLLPCVRHAVAIGVRAAPDRGHGVFEVLLVEADQLPPGRAGGPLHVGG